MFAPLLPRRLLITAVRSSTNSGTPSWAAIQRAVMVFPTPGAPTNADDLVGCRPRESSLLVCFLSLISCARLACTTLSSMGAGNSGPSLKTLRSDSFDSPSTGNTLPSIFDGTSRRMKCPLPLGAMVRRKVSNCSASSGSIPRYCLTRRATKSRTSSFFSLRASLATWTKSDFTLVNSSAFI
ncbi:hypothetical protein ALO43_200069 [Pseudomonas tremae]|uniref:Uncharacterized protein n=1 Tax=Pseudomonas tremae TaxID=200454 RepID=A0AA40P8F6_9PSED|nr:hypothetical protein ALO43_200069 [Pseudomonas tremae]